MAVRLLLSSGGKRLLERADGARLDGHFFVVTRARPSGELETVLTLRAEDVVGAEVMREGVRIDYVSGKGQAPES